MLRAAQRWTAQSALRSGVGGVRASSRLIHASSSARNDIDPIKGTDLGDGKYEFTFQEPTTHKCDGPVNKSVTTAEELIQFYETMYRIRRLEIAADGLYKAKYIRGFLHLYNGQEAICTGIESSITYEDSIITAYRAHGFQLTRGDTPYNLLCELIGKADGSSKGKGGSMHTFLPENEFYGGNGIVGAQTPIGAGVAYAHKYQGKDNVCYALYGDGASNQGQLFEAFNMASLWDLPVIFCCENNRYGMGTSMKRSSASQDYYSRGDFIPGIRVDGMDVLATKEVCKYATEHARKGAPFVIEFDSYRYVGHSMSDPGLSYRSRDEVNDVRASRDPIEQTKKRLLENEMCTSKDLKAIEKRIKKEIDEAVKAAHAAPYPELPETYTQVLQEPIPVRACELSESYSPQ